MSENRKTILCPLCRSITKVTDASRRDKDGKHVASTDKYKRRRECIKSGHRFNTVELPEKDLIELLATIQRSNDMFQMLGEFIERAKP